MPSKDHHYLPQAHLRRFSAREDGAVYRYDKRFSTKPDTKQPRGQGYAEHLYTYTPQTGDRTSHIEDDLLQKIDNLGAKELTAVVEGQSAIDFANLSTYVASLLLRNPWAIASNQAQGSLVLSEVYRRRYLYDPELRANLREATNSEEEFQNLWSAAHPDFVQVNMHQEFSMTTVIQSIPKVAITLLNCDWHLLVAQNSDEEFVISDVPVFGCVPQAEGKLPVGILTPGCETILPIDPKNCFLLTPGKSCGMSRSYVSSDVVSEINNRSAYSAQERFFGSSNDEKLIALSKIYPPRYPNVTDKSPMPNVMFLSNEVDNQHFSAILPLL